MVVVAVLVLSLVIPFNVAASRSNAYATSPVGLNPTFAPPLNNMVIQDPSGTYWFKYLGGGQYSTDIATYQAVLKDPYNGISASQVQVIGNTVLLTTPQPTLVTEIPSTATQGIASPSTSYPTSSNFEWSGAGGGFCTFVSQGLNGMYCGSPQYTLNISQVYIASLSWNSACWSGSSCVTSFWTGLSSSYTGGTSSDLIQNGITVCYSDSQYCPNGTGSGSMTWNMFWNELPGNNYNQVLATYPTTINGVVYEFEIFWTSSTSATFFWDVGSWSDYLTIASNYTQSNFVQSEGIFESPFPFGFGPPVVTWSSNPSVMTGWYRAAGYWKTAACGNIGSGYPLALYTLIDSSGTTEAYGWYNPNNTYTFLAYHK